MTRPAFLTLAMHEHTLHVHFTAERADRSRSTEGAYRLNGTHVTSAREMISIQIAFFSQLVIRHMPYREPDDWLHEYFVEIAATVYGLPPLGEQVVSCFLCSDNEHHAVVGAGVRLILVDCLAAVHAPRGVVTADMKTHVLLS